METQTDGRRTETASAFVSGEIPGSPAEAKTREDITIGFPWQRGPGVAQHRPWGRLSLFLAAVLVFLFTSLIYLFASEVEEKGEFELLFHPRRPRGRTT